MTADEHFSSPCSSTKAHDKLELELPERLAFLFCGRVELQGDSPGFRPTRHPFSCAEVYLAMLRASPPKGLLKICEHFPWGAPGFHLLSSEEAPGLPSATHFPGIKD